MKVNCNVHIDSEDDEFDGKDFVLPANQTWLFDIDYPLNAPYHHQFNTGSSCGFSKVLGEVRKAYDMRG
jgi:hypothetical protein